LQFVFVALAVSFLSSPAQALVDNTVCDVNTQSAGASTWLSFPYAAAGFNRTTNRECEEKIQFVPANYNIVLSSTVEFTNGDDGDFNGDGKNLIVDGAGATVTFDATGMNPDTCVFLIKNGKSLWKNLTVKVHKAEKAFCDQGGANDFSGVTILADVPPEDLDKDDDGKNDDEDNCPDKPNADQKDKDNDGKGDVCDICPDVKNPDQLDSDHDGQGNACEPPPPPDADGDTIPDADDNCKNVANKNQADEDHDDVGDACDNCPQDPNVNTEATDCNKDGDKTDPGEGVGAQCDTAT